MCTKALFVKQKITALNSIERKVFATTKIRMNTFRSVNKIDYIFDFRVCQYQKFYKLGLKIVNPISLIIIIN